nr:HAMP domain-containing histidine kinase [Saprospiraceae bacterium]
SYIRFLDLQKAEEQTREAQIETSLERIRAATLAMQSTDQLSSVILFIYGELNKITSELNRCFFMIFDPQNLGVTWWMAGVDTPDLGKGFFVPYSEHAPQMAYLKGWQEKKERWQYRMQGDEKRKWDNYLFHHTDLARLPDVIKDNMQAFTDIYLDGSFNSFGCLTTGSPIPLSTKAVDLLVRYSKVFDLSFTRYNDLKQAEAQARESQIETALEKIRSSSLAMQKSHEIKSVVTTLFQKLKELKVDFNGAAAIHIFNDTTKDAVIWVATPTLESTIEVQLPYDADYFTDNPIITDIWHAKETGQDIITKIYPLQEKNRYFQYVFKHNPQIPDFEQKRIYNELNYSATFIAQPNSLLGVNSWSDNQLITDEQYKLLKRVGYVFEQAYVRFLDLQKAEALAEQARLDLIQIQTEKKRAEDALKELSATQAQLIQSEKMASLGELTAGIAHEIQNPLNFVNNFSEINNDLINELKEEFEKGNKQQATELINDIKINSEKIHHHGHRASSIVKNMLEHSRKSSGVKSHTDINALCDEFLRLAYHGLRGRDKSFNSDYSIDPDLSLPKINVISQDISRVILNLVTNAFYAVCEKSKQFNIQDYKPEVTVKTRKTHEEIEIHINDNGPGIPDSIKDKIFQPFFTTKPTGQGTGLGLSLSYDIVKAHGGSIKVSSPQGHGTSFVITLPIA